MLCVITKSVVREKSAEFLQNSIYIILNVYNFMQYFVVIYGYDSIILI